MSTQLRESLTKTLEAMRTGKNTFSSPLRHWPEMTMRVSIGVAALWSGVALQALAHARPQSLCATDESVQFSCAIGKKSVSLCAAPAAGPFESLTYRFGTAAKTELTFAATTENGRTFSFDVAPAAPQASVSQVWFDIGSSRYLLTECSGGRCPSAAGLTVLRRGRVVMNRSCAWNAGEPAPGFTGDLVDFGSSAATSRSKTPLVIPDPDRSSDVSRIYEVNSFD